MATDQLLKPGPIGLFMKQVKGHRGQNEKYQYRKACQIFNLQNILQHLISCVLTLYGIASS